MYYNRFFGEALLFLSTIFTPNNLKFSNMKLSSTLLLLFFSTFAFAQITITANNVPATGDQLDFAIDTVPLGFTPSPAGPDQMWDFTALSEDFNYTESIIDPAGTPGAADFPNATGVIDQGGGFFNYLETKDDGLYVLGIFGDFLGFGTPISVPLNPPQKNFALPSTYQTNYTDNYKAVVTIESPLPQADSIRVINDANAVSEIDAYGVLETPLGYYNVLRQKVTTTTEFSVAFQIFGIWFEQESNTTTETTYTFFNKEVKGRLLSYTVDSVGMAGEITFSTIPGAQGMPPVASFDAQDQGSNTFLFTDASYDNITSRTWDFGDGVTMTTAATSITHTYAMAGEYTVCLLVENAFGTDQLCKPLTIISAPTAAFTYSDNFEGLVNFQDASSGGPATWLWDFGDGNTSTDENPSHTFAAPGNYNVCLTVSNAVGDNMTCQTVSPLFKPAANFSYVDPSTGTVTFTDESSNSPSSWSWDFGDGNTSVQQNPSNDYSSGQYTVCLTATNAAGSNQTCEEITVIISSIKDLVPQLDLAVFPNPASDFIQIKLDTPLKENATIVITNTLGQHLYTNRLQQQQTLDLNDWAAGAYHWNVLSEEGQIMARGAFALMR